MTYIPTMFIKRYMMIYYKTLMDIVKMIKTKIKMKNNTKSPVNAFPLEKEDNIINKYIEKNTHSDSTNDSPKNSPRTIDKETIDETNSDTNNDTNSDTNSETNSDNKSMEKTIIPPDIVLKKNNKHLICDDAFANRLVLKKYLLLYNCEVDEAENGQDAIKKVIENGIYKIIWMDIKMPKMNGFDCTEQLIKTAKYEGPIIGLTGYVDEPTVKKCYALGMSHVLAKPFDKKVIKDYCEKYQ